MADIPFNIAAINSHKDPLGWVDGLKFNIAAVNSHKDPLGWVDGIKFNVVAIKKVTVQEYTPDIYRENEYFPYTSPLQWFNIDFKAQTNDITLAMFNENITITNDGNTLTPTEITSFYSNYNNYEYQLYHVICDLPYDSEMGGSGIPLSIMTHNGSLMYQGDTPIPVFTTTIEFGFIGAG